MKKLILSCLLLLISCILYAQDKQAILKVLATQQQDWNRGNIDAFMQSYWKSDSLLFFGQKRP